MSAEIRATAAGQVAVPAAGTVSPTLVVLFDGHCNFCSSVVNFLIDRDPRGRLKFAALQSEAGQRLLAAHGLPMPDVPDTMVFIEGDRAHVRSDAALATTKYLSGLWPLVRVGFVVPRFVRDAVYKVVATNRYRWFGKTESCRIPTPALRARFLD
jgi:predicted DCC family thiol-disulfide oxidoreductase YuxK